VQLVIVDILDTMAESMMYVKEEIPG